MSNKFYKIIISIFLTLVFGYVLSKLIDFRIFPSYFKKINIELLSLSFLVYLLSIIIRTLRWSFVFIKKSFIDIFHITNAHNVANNFLPARIGEFILPVLLKRILKTGFTKSLTLLFFIRYIDLIILLGFLYFSSLFIFEFFSKIFVFLFAIFGLFGLGMLIFQFKTLASCIILLAKKLKIKKFNLEEKANEINLLINDNQDKQTLLILISLSVTILFLRYLSFWLILLSIQYKIALHETFFGFTFSDFMMALPFNSFASIGTMEAGWVLGSKIIGENIQHSLPLGAFVHTIVLCFSGITGVISIIYIYFKSNKL